MGKIGQIFLILGSIGTFIFLAASTGGNYWIKNKFNDNAGSGLWKTCYYGHCGSFSIDLDWFRAVRAFAVMATLAAVAAILLSILNMVSESMKPFFASFFLFGAAGCMVIALAIFTDKLPLRGLAEYGWSYILGWLGALGGIVAGVIGLLADKC